MNKRLLHAAQTVLTEPVEAEGMEIELRDTVKAPMRGLRVYGKSTQDGTPSPGNPVEIVSVGDVGSVNVKISGKNLFDSSNLIQNYNAMNFFQIKVPNGTYTLSSDVPRDYNGNECYIFLVSGYKDNITGITSDKNGLNKGVSRTVETDDGYVTIAYRYQNRIGEFSDYWYQLEMGDKATKYQPYSNQSIQISTPTGLPGIPVSSGGNYTDTSGQQWACDEVDFERGVYVQRVYNKIINDFSNAYVGSAVGGYTEGMIDTKKAMLHEMKGLCDKFSYISIGNITRFACYYSFLYFTIPGELSGTEWIQAMNEISPHVMMPLKEPIEKPLSAAELAAYKSLHSNYPTTIITNSEDTRMKVNCMKIRGGV